MGESIWKKEISLGRKPKEPKEPKPPKAEKAEKQSFWKKEISLGGKPKAPKAPKAEQPPKAEQQSIWKKEISFSRKKRERDVERLVQQAAQVVSPSFAAVEPPAVEAPPPTALAEAAVAAMPEPEAEPPAPEPVAYAADPEPAVEPEPVAAPEPAPIAAVPDPAAPASPVERAFSYPSEPQPLDVAAAAEVPVLPVEVPVAPSGLSPAIVAASAEPEPPVEAVAPPAPEPLPAAPLETAPVEEWMEPQPVEQWAAEQPAEPWLAAPEVPPASEPESSVVVHPPVPAAELPPLPPAAKTPFWKKELSFGGKSKQPKEPKPPKAAKEASTPFWKKELSLGGKPKQPKEPKPPKAAKAPSAPFWKRDFSPSLSLPKLSKPARPSGGRARGGSHKAKKFVGLKVGASQIAAARVANNGSVELLQLVREPLDPGVVVSGELRDPDALAEALKRFFARNKLPRKNVRLGIASNRIGVRIFDVAGIDDEKQLENAIHFRAQEALPIPLDEAVLDYHVLGESVDEEGNSTRRILLVVAYRELVDRYVGACRKAGISLTGIDLEAFALLRALSAPRPEGEQSDSALVAVAVGHDRSTFAVSDGRICEFTRVLEWGGASLSVAIARALNLAPSEVEAIKRALSLESTEVPQGMTPEQYALAVDAVRKQVQSFARELVSSLQFYQNQPGSLGIGEIVITGGTASLAGLAAELQRLIGVRVRVGDPLARVRLAKKVTADDQVGSLAVAIGLGIED